MVDLGYVKINNCSTFWKKISKPLRDQNKFITKPTVFFREYFELKLKKKQKKFSQNHICNNITTKLWFR